MGREEVELKLALAPGGVQALRRSALWSSLQGAAERRLTSTYYDTGKRDLLAQDYSLRVRRQGGRFIQTLKAGAGRRTPGLFRRGEWEGPLHDATPDPALIVDGKVPRRIRDLRPAQLQPVLSTRIHRRLRSLRDGPTMVELALDTGAVLGADGTQRQPICELELELKEGMPAGLFALAHEINQITPVRLQRRSKLQQGLAGDAPQPRWQKATPLRLSPEMPVAAALAAIFDNCLDHMVANEACAITGAHVEGV
ncbi:MAG TPA: CYTH domain-containing protein, partial [Alphaproteobacteria bacterium]|nr:CYTH domain-containing protein [Alphaproteobacteria bacterium]